MEDKFIIKMDPDAFKEYEDLDNSIVGEVDKALESLEKRADQVGKRLGKKRQIDLTGSKEKKLRRSGVRIIYTITNEYVEVLQIVVILAIGYKKDETKIYKNAQTRSAIYKDVQISNGIEQWASTEPEVSEPSEFDEPDTFLYYILEYSDNQYEARHEVIDSVKGNGSSASDAVEQLGINLYHYAQEYIENHHEYFNNPETNSHFKYVISIIELAGANNQIHNIIESLHERE
ncbi:hypothetical protein [Radiobacillus sp. PE A8.2]|uniref:hypothetical protein n=1 Tax=Radiobacillus sp. PE A8.2 TaxID=3380349 RepID=UPI00388EB5C6